MTQSLPARIVFSISAILLFTTIASAKTSIDSGSAPIPVFRPSCFTASPEQGQAVLQWVADPEPGISHYVIEYSVTGSLFSPLVNIVPGKTDSYTYRHKRIGKEPVQYYRIKKVKKDGTVSRSYIRVVRFK